MKQGQLIIDISSYWQPGSGEGGGYGFDRGVRRDHRGLPLIPGRTLKGLLREAVESAEAFGWYRERGEGSGIAETLFGREADSEHDSRPGLLRFGNAVLPEALAAYLGQENDEASRLRAGLYHTLYAVAIDDATGTAREQALRSIEVSVPMQLQARIEALPERWDARNPLHDRWHDLLTQALPLVRAVGALRSRGLGRAELKLEPSR